jgi:hypothetical protein
VEDPKPKRTRKRKTQDDDQPVVKLPMTDSFARCVLARPSEYNEAARTDAIALARACPALLDDLEVDPTIRAALDAAPEVLPLAALDGKPAADHVAKPEVAAETKATPRAPIVPEMKTEADDQYRMRNLNPDRVAKRILTLDGINGGELVLEIDAALRKLYGEVKGAGEKAKGALTIKIELKPDDDGGFQTATTLTLTPPKRKGEGYFFDGLEIIPGVRKKDPDNQLTINDAPKVEPAPWTETGAMDTDNPVPPSEETTPLDTANAPGDSEEAPPQADCTDCLETLNQAELERGAGLCFGCATFAPEAEPRDVAAMIAADEQADGEDGAPCPGLVDVTDETFADGSEADPGQEPEGAEAQESEVE